MAGNMEQVAETGRWTDRPERLISFRDQPFLPEPGCSRASRIAALNRIVEAEILPRLARKQQMAQAVNDGTATRFQHSTTDDDAAELVRLLLTEEASAAMKFITRLGRRGVTPAALYLGIMTQAARRLGELRDEDRCDFVQLTISMGRLQLLVRALSPDFQRAAIRRPQGETVLLLPAPGDQHMFGLMLLAEFFIREAWHVRGGPGFSADEAVAIARRTRIDVVGFSIGSCAHIDALANVIQAVRRTSRNQHLRVMVGGPLFTGQPGLAERIGADVTMGNPQAAVMQAGRLVNPRRQAEQR
jgi:MerR family transcriptional regulator, light-induced transcriptional regulator